MERKKESDRRLGKLVVTKLIASKRPHGDDEESSPRSRNKKTRVNDEGSTVNEQDYEVAEENAAVAHGIDNNYDEVESGIHVPVPIHVDIQVSASPVQ